jgi:hypothetical protein
MRPDGVLANHERISVKMQWLLPVLPASPQIFFRRLQPMQATDFGQLSDYFFEPHWSGTTPSSAAAFVIPKRLLCARDLAWQPLPRSRWRSLLQ